MTNSRPHHLPARVLTLDQAYAFAYGDLRRRLDALARVEPDMQRSAQLWDLLDESANRLEDDLRTLFLGDDLAAKLARPE